MTGAEPLASLQDLLAVERTGEGEGVRTGAGQSRAEEAGHSQPLDPDNHNEGQRVVPEPTSKWKDCKVSKTRVLKEKSTMTVL